MQFFACTYKIEHRMQICQRNPRVACSADHISNIPLRELNLSLKNRDDIKKYVSHPRYMYASRPIRPYHFQADLIWCDGTFKLTQTCIYRKKYVNGFVNSEDYLNKLKTRRDAYLGLYIYLSIYAIQSPIQLVRQSL
jgi:hypothetical protein